MGAGSLASGLIQSNASQNAAATQAAASNKATDTQLGIYNQTVANLAPYNQTGQSALSQLSSLFGLGPVGGGPTSATAANATSALTQYPGYKFGLQQGQTALDRSAASQGLLLSGGQLKASQQYGQNYALQNAWNPYVNQLNSLSSLGENAAAQAGNNGATTGASVAGSIQNAGAATASGIMGSSNALTGGLQSGLQNAALASLLQNNGGSGNNSLINSINQNPLQPFSGMGNISG
jgi:hypothetical protein